MKGRNEIVDVVVVGAGPAGLTAALYLGRYHRSVLVLHDGRSRALRIPLTHNVPGFPDGVVGTELIARMSGHAESYGSRIEEAEVTRVERRDGLFMVSGGGRVWHARALILATGIALHEVDLPRPVHEAAIAAGVLRYCPICDGYEHTDRSIGVIGCDANGAAEALFLRQYSPHITLMPLSHPELSAEQLAELTRAGIKVEQGALAELRPGPTDFKVMLEGRSGALSFDVVYPALGCTPRADLAVQLGVRRIEGCVPATAPNETAVPGFFAAGDVVEGLDQISVAAGHGALAATSAHNWLREQDNQTLQAAE